MECLTCKVSYIKNEKGALAKFAKHKGDSCTIYSVKKSIVTLNIPLRFNINVYILHNIGIDRHRVMFVCLH